MTKVEEPNPTLATPLTTTYSYYVFGPQYQVSQSGQTRTFIHDQLGRLLSETRPESGTTTYQYDNDSRLASRTDARPVTTTYSYDVIDRLLTTTYSLDVPGVARVYDENGHTGFLTSQADGAGNTSFTYNAAGQVASEGRVFTGVTGTFTTSYEYDKEGKLRALTYPSGHVVEYNYPSGGGVTTGRMTSMTDASTSTTLLQSIQYNPAGQMSSQLFANGVVETRDYNARAQLTAVTATLNTTTLLNLAYGYGVQNVGRIRERIDAIQPEHSAQYAYDSIYRLKQAAAANWTWGIAWSFDAFGNRTAQTPYGLASGKAGAQTLGYFNNRISGLAYNPAGDLTNDTLHVYSYDGEDRIISVDGAIHFTRHWKKQ